MKGKIITIEGGDGTGKQTQAAKLVSNLREKGYDVETLSFPQYDKPTGKIIRAYLNGEFGNLNEINAKTASALYASDRLSAQDKMQSWINDGKIIVLDRYYESNMAHQGAKLPESERKEFVKWLYDFEVHKLGILKSDLVVFLKLPLDVAEKAMQIQGRQKDIHEKDVSYAMEVHKTYPIAAKIFDWKVVDCMSDDVRRLTVGDLSEKILKIVLNFLD